MDLRTCPYPSVLLILLELNLRRHPKQLTIVTNRPTVDMTRSVMTCLLWNWIRIRIDWGSHVILLCWTGRLALPCAAIEGLQAPGYPAGSVLSKNYEVAITRYDDPSSSVSAATSPSPSASSPSPSPSFPLPTPVPSPPITASSSSNATPPPSHEAYTTSTVQIPNHPHILALTAYRPSRGLVANETFGVSFAVTMRQPSGPGAQKTVTVPTKLALSVKRIVEVYDEEQQQPPLDEKGKGKGRAPPLSSSSPSVLTPTSTPPLPVPVPSHLAASPSPSASPPTTNASRFGIMIKQRASNAFGSMGIQRKQHRRREGGKNVSPIVSENERGQTSSISEEEGIGGQPSSFHSTSGMEVDGDGEGDAEADGVAAAANMGGGMFSLFERRRPWRGTSPSPSPSPAASRVRQEDVDFAALSPSPQSSATPTPTLPSPTSSSVHKTVLATESGLFVPITAAPDASLSLSRTATMASSATNLTITTTSSSSDRTIMPAMMPYSPSSWSLPPSYSSLTFPDSQSTSSLSPLLQQAVSTSALSGSEENTALYGTSISLNIPSQRSGGHWGLGESMKTKMVSIKFLLSCKITMTTTTLSSPSSSPTQFTSFGNTTGAPASSMASTVITETIKVAPIEFTISAITPSDRAKIISDYDLAVKKARQQQREKEKEKKARHNSHTPTPQLASASATRDAHLPVPVPTRGRSLSPSAHHRHHPTTKNERVPPASPRSDSSEGSQSRTVRADSATTTEALVPMQTSPTAESFVDISSSTGLPSAHNGPSGSAGGKLSFFTRRSPTPAPVLTSGAGGISSTLGLPAPTSSAQPVRPQPLRRPSTAGSITSASRRTESDAMAIDEMPKDMWSSPSLNVRRSSARATATRTSSSSGPKPTQLVRRPKTSNGVVTVPGSTNVTASPANPAAPPTGSGIGLRRRRSLSPPLPPSARSSSSSRRLPPPSTSGVGGSASPAAAFGVAVSAKGSSTIQVDVIGHDTVRAWEEELDRIAARSKRRSIQLSPRASMASGAGRVGGTARS
ncbi:hypothetical protein DL93DRAFT_174961 [Clavulina sp. PMI_390]|nr:hypothetical protein DL93DRAFT_174961 [Clavulina sp. PMI_390]